MKTTGLNSISLYSLFDNSRVFHLLRPSSQVSSNMPRYEDRRGGTRLYVGHLSSRTRSRDLEDMFSRYGR
ncbi:hypothetical protein Gogos_000270 [Gossypium gossypioides]|uniref:RRM domain-containing protein n=1 Tax=Gossypium gossypioides TaxID=34282 RepID=A0A7J9CS66_GOSGO|nr:hypothetical protein [Gossypium gossypioides]